MNNSDKCCGDLNPGMDEISFLFGRIVKLWRRSHDRLLSDLDITGPQFEILAAIHQLSLEGNEVSQILISSHTLIDPMTTSTTLRNLQKKKMITRKSSKVDTRALVVEFTKEGRIAFDEAVRRLLQVKATMKGQIDEEGLVYGMKKFLEVLIKLDESSRLVEDSSK